MDIADASRLIPTGRRPARPLYIQGDQDGGILIRFPLVIVSRFLCRFVCFLQFRMAPVLLLPYLVNERFRVA